VGGSRFNAVAVWLSGFSMFDVSFVDPRFLARFRGVVVYAIHL
jgi:hypothetical protein